MQVDNKGMKGEGKRKMKREGKGTFSMISRGGEESR